MKTTPLLLLAALTLAACGESDLPTSPSRAAPRPPVHTVDHWTTGGVPGFWFSFDPPPAGWPAMAFDGTLSPTVEVCRVTNGACGPVLATFTRTTGSYGRLVTVDAANGYYRVTWPTGSTGASAGEVYRVSVRVGSRTLGFTDVLMVTSFWQLFSTDETQFYPWIAGVNLTLSFSISQGIPGAVQATASSLALNVGDGKPLAATVLDLHGQPLAGADAIFWVQDPPGASASAAAVDSGLVVGLAPGTATVWAWWGDVSVAVPVTVTDTRRAWTSVAPAEMESRAIWGASATNLYTATHTGVAHYDGTSWSFVDAVRWRDLSDVTGFSANDVWAVGTNGTILRWNGTAWSAWMFDGTSVSPLPLGVFDPPARRIALRGVWGASSSSLVAVGDSGTVLVFDGTQWRTRPSGTTAALTDVWGTSATDFYATAADGRILHFGATSVSPVAGVQAPGALNGIWGSSASNVYAVGEGGMVYRYNGTAWTRVRLPTRATLYTVWGRSAAEVYAAGAEGALYRYNGTAWTPEKRPGGNGQIYGVWGLPTATWAVGSGMIAQR